MNITLSAEADLIRKARAAARSRGKSLNQMVREYMQSLCDMDGARSAVSRLFEIMDDGRGDMRGRRFDRNESHER